MKARRSIHFRRLIYAFLIAIFAIGAIYYIRQANFEPIRPLSDGDTMIRFVSLGVLAAIASFSLLTACKNAPASIAATSSVAAVEPLPSHAKPFMAQVVGVQWLNPLQRRDYPTEWQLLWTLGLAKPNKADDMVEAKPKKYSVLQAVGPIAAGNDGRETFKGFHHKYLKELTLPLFGPYFKYSTYFYNAHSTEDKSTWRELAGIHVEYALPEGRLDPEEAKNYLRERIAGLFNIGNLHFPTTWSRSTPPDVHVHMGGPNAGFTSLSAALDYLQAHPDETVWAMNWDAPNFPPKDEQINENMVLLVLAGPSYKTGRNALAWIGHPASRSAADFEAKKGLPSRPVQAWQATVMTAAANAGKEPIDIGYTIHDANNTHQDSPDRLGNLAQTLTMEVPELDFGKQSFNTPALLGEMGAGTALTNVALGIAYANHLGKNVLVAGTSDLSRPTAVLVVPPEKVRPIDHEVPWFRARSEAAAYLMWWGLRHDAEAFMQGYSE
ncbi:virulence factor [Pseudoduganella sp. SL102]|uniref:virulence factor n=1 Tax=Pseudoduganella sp. SL102 TaxID=2995154 RepID=UPI00248CD8B8|nr:virulence factor [Pseudoduganella sp. SL102]WBS01996.1 virulence factor [Pseudoduganella sp. SL102]